MKNRRHFGRTRTGSVKHVVTSVPDWYSGMRLTAECGARVDVLAEKAGFVTLPVGTCLKCAAALGCKVRG